MSDAPAADAAPVSAPASTGVQISDTSPLSPAPANTTNIPSRDGETQEGQPPSAKERVSIGEAIRRAHAKVLEETQTKDKAEGKVPRETLEKKPKSEAEATKSEKQAEPATKRPVDERGRFVSQKPAEGAPDASQQPRAAQPHDAPPQRFSAEAKAAWSRAEEPVRAEVHRAIRELETGIQKYRADAEAYHPLRPLDQFARRNGTTVEKVLTPYLNIDKQLSSRDPAQIQQGMDVVFRKIGVTPQQWARAILNQPQDQTEIRHSREMRMRDDRIAQLERGYMSIAQAQQEQKQSAVLSDVTAFAQDGKHPRFDELSAGHLEYSIQSLLRSGMIPMDLPPHERLQKAYEAAERLNPAENAGSLRPAPGAANGAGTKSITGSPANGSDPSVPARKKGQNRSIRESIEHARAVHGR